MNRTLWLQKEIKASSESAADETVAHISAGIPRTFLLADAGPLAAELLLSYKLSWGMSGGCLALLLVPRLQGLQCQAGLMLAGAGGVVWLGGAGGTGLPSLLSSHPDGLEKQ